MWLSSKFKTKLLICGAIFFCSSLSAFAQPSLTKNYSLALRNKIVNALLVHPATAPANPTALANSVSGALASTCTSTPCTEVDLVATPNYALFDVYGSTGQAVVTNCVNGSCNVSPTGSSSVSIIQGISTIQSQASARSVPIYLASVLERVASSDNRLPLGLAYFNSMLLINESGVITKIRREVSRNSQQGWITCGSVSGVAYESCLDAREDIALDSVSIEKVHTARNETVTVLPVFGYDRDNSLIAAELAGQGSAEILLALEFGGDTQFLTIENAIQNGTWTRGVGGWSWGVNDTFIETFKNQLTPHSQLLAIEKTNQEGALIHLGEPPSAARRTPLHYSTYSLLQLETVPRLVESAGLGFLLVKNPDNLKIEPAIAKLSAGLAGVCGNTGDCRPRVHTAVTPEFAFFQSSFPLGYMVELQCSAQGCTPIATNNGDSLRVVNAIAAAKLLALQYGVEILLGTVAEKVVTAQSEFPLGYIVYNSLLRIDRDGKLHRMRWKVADGDWETCGTLSGSAYDACVLWKTYYAALTVHKREISFAGQTLSYLPLICSERSRPIFLAAAQLLGIRNVDLLVGPEREGDIQYENIMNDIQASQWNSTLWGWDWGIRDVFIRNFINQVNIVRPGGYIAVTDAGFAQAAVFQLSEPPAKLNKQPTVATDWVHAIVPFD